MNHDLEDLLDAIKKLEHRVIFLERAMDSIQGPTIDEDRWYWLH